MQKAITIPTALILLLASLVTPLPEASADTEICPDDICHDLSNELQPARDCIEEAQDPTETLCGMWPGWEDCLEQAPWDYDCNPSLVRWSLEFVAACVQNQQSSSCRPVFQSVQDCIEGEADTACATVLDCIDNNNGNACEAAHTCIEDIDQNNQGGPCGTLVSTVESCQQGNPSFPCDPNVTHGFEEPEACQFDCFTEPVAQFDEKGGIPLPDLYLIRCEVEEPVTGLMVPHLVTSQTGDCLIGERDQSFDPLPLLEDDSTPRLDDENPILELTSGECDYRFTLTVYGLGLPGNDVRLPCAFLAPA